MHLKKIYINSFPLDTIFSFIFSEFKFGNDVMDQQVSCLWQGQHLLSVSLSGFINYLDLNNPDKPLRIIKVNIHAFKIFDSTRII